MKKLLDGQWITIKLFSQSSTTGDKTKQINCAIKANEQQTIKHTHHCNLSSFRVQSVEVSDVVPFHALHQPDLRVQRGPKQH